jgi:hypothetical protein
MPPITVRMQRIKRNVAGDLPVVNPTSARRVFRRRGTRSYNRAMRTGLAKAGWIVLIVLNAGMLLNHLVAIFLVATSADEGRMFIAYAVVNALALLVLFFAYRVGQRWAWASIWLVVLATAVTIAYGIDTIGLIYLAVAGVMALAQLATAREFFGAVQA